MTKANSSDDEMRPEYKREDLGSSVRGKYYDNYQAAHNIVLLNPEVAKAYPTEEAVNDALLSLIQVAQKSVGKPRR